MTTSFEAPQTFRLLKTDIAAKLSTRSEGGITYIVMADLGDWPDLHLAVTANEGGGLWSREAVALSTIEAIIDGFATQPFPTKALKEATVGRSANNAPFLLAVLKDLGLAQSSPDKHHHYVKAGDWSSFRNELLLQDGPEITYPEVTQNSSDEEATNIPGNAADTSSAPTSDALTAAKPKRKKKPVKAESEPVDPDEEDGHDAAAQ
ncbi:hypothetical protein [Comamonas thiooxydans]|uniref:hypothetical protein n=1 Tax=Comamonas thiooxydans TaxID=363952 RepID=UPI00209C1C09|nr:hypothetical protein [Comamonas thiooxydans]MCO8250740.1 hypothetical protein [Comamonas thiooxydans]